MDYSKLDFFTMTRVRMKHLAQTQDKLARNIVNADNPNFKAEEIKEPDFSRQLGRMSTKLAMMTTSGGHRSGGEMGGGKTDFDAQKMKKPFEVKPTRNMVSIEEQMVMVNDAAMKYQETANLVSKVSQMIKLALGNRGA